MLKKAFKDRRVILAVSLLALFSLVLLAGAIDHAFFRPARRLTREELEVVQVPVGDVFESAANIPLEKLIAFLVMLVLLGALAIYLLPPEMRKKLFKQILRFALGVILFLILLKLKPDLLDNLFPFLNPAMGQQDDLTFSEAAPPPVFEPPQVPGWVSFLVAFGIVLLTAFFIWRINRWRQTVKLSAKPPSPLDQIAQAARVSLRNLSAGGDVQDKIIQCYADMTRVADARRGLFREYAMTPAEFAARLENAGLPSEPVRRLTRLFEAVRYGARTSTQSDVDEAMDCLQSIVKFCGEAAP